MRWILFIGGLLCLSLCCTKARGEVVRVEITGRENCESGNCSLVSAVASGVTVGRLPDGSDGILTAGHSYRGMESARTVVCWFEEQRLPARVIAIGESVDAALLSVRLPTSPKCSALAETAKSGELVRCYGFPADREYQAHEGMLAGDVVPGVFSIPGESGGPVFQSGQIVGLIRGNDHQGMVIESCARIRVWMRAQIGYIPECGPRAVAQPQKRPVAPAPPAESVACDCAGRFAEINSKIEKIQAGRVDGRLLVEIRTDLDRLQSEYDDLAKRLKAVEDSRIAVQIRSKGKVVDEDTYPRTGPIILDFARVGSGSR